MKRNFLFFVIILLTANVSQATTLKEVKKNGVLRHLGAYYARFNTGTGSGFDADMIKMFADHIGVKYQHVPTTLATVITDLSGIKIRAKGNQVEILGSITPKGDIIANGLTVLPWRKKVIQYSDLTFPTQVWLLARIDSKIQPIKPSGDIQKDIENVKKKLKGKVVLEKPGTCLDASLYNLAQAGSKVKTFHGKLVDLAPAIIMEEAETTMLDVPDALIALEKWGGEIKIIGPLSKFQGMAAAFTKDADDLKAEFNKFLKIIKNDGRYYTLVEKYYPLAFSYFPEFFHDVKPPAN